MDKKRRLYFICGGAALALLALIAVICLIAGSNEPKVLENAEAVYQEAVNYLNGQEALQLNISCEKTTTAGSRVITEKASQVVTYEGLGTQAFRGSADQTLTIGQYSISISELYADGTGYFIVNNTPFSGAITQEEYRSRYAPAAPLTVDHYASVTGTYTKEAAQICFSKAAVAESWAVTGAENVQAEGTAYLDAEGKLTKSDYTLQCTQGDTQISLRVTVELTEAAPVALPDDTSGYTRLTCLDAPLLLETACGYLLSAGTVSAAYTDTLSCEAFGDIRRQTIDLHITTAGTARVDTAVTLENTGKAGVVSSTNKTERFENGSYQVTVDGGESATNSEIDAAAMEQYCRDILLSTLMLPQYIQEAVLTETDTQYRIQFTADEAFAQMLSGEACTILYQDADVLTGMAQTSSTDTVSCYLYIDKATGMPAASGFSYAGTYTISQLPYRLIYQADQAYSYE